MINFSSLKNRIIIVMHDLLMVPIAWFMAYWFRFNLGNIPDSLIQKAVYILPILVLIQAVAYRTFGLYRGVWRFASIPDLVRIVKAVTVGTICTVFICFTLNQLMYVPRSIFPLYALILILMLGGPRMIYRWVKDNNGKLPAKRVLIIGAGESAERLIRDLLRDKALQYKPVAIIDDKLRNQGLEIHGIRVVGQIKDIKKIVSRYNINLIIIASSKTSVETMNLIVENCSSVNVPFRILPETRDPANNSGIVSLREVLLEDLLNRDLVKLDWHEISESLTSKVVLITGGGGSIGSELCRQIAHLSPSQLIVIENTECNLYEIERQILEKFPHIEFFGYLIDILDRVQLNKVIQRHAPFIIFHVAAYKHVPLLESQLRAAVRNNTVGTYIMAEEASKANVKKFVLISTDKAVNPTNIMGATKRAAEIFCQNFSKHSNTHFVTVRFGNVLGSTGSVIPLFRKQLEKGGPITVTHPDITRFFMTVQESVELIMQAMTMGKGGEIFVLDMGEPVKIQYLAEQMIRLSGRTPYKDIQIIHTGLRPGEKLYEELFHEQEELLNTQHAKIMLSRYRQWDWNDLTQVMNELIIACEESNEQLIYQLLLKLVPEYQASYGTKSELILA